MTVKYPDNINSALLERIPLTARTVLDIGCNSGALGQAYKRRNPTALVFGVESNQDAAKIAATRLDRVYLNDFDGDLMLYSDEIKKNDFDCILIENIHDKVCDFLAILRRHIDFLAPDGLVLLSLPNSEHWSFAVEMLRGGWHYQDTQLSELTHIKRFSEETIRLALCSVGLQVIDVTPHVSNYEDAEAFVDAISPALARLGVNQAEYLRRCAPLQLVWRACRKALPRLHVVSTMLSPIGGVSQVRVVEPMQALGSDPTISASVIGSGDLPTQDGQGPGIFIFHRPLLAGQQGLERIKYLVARGWLVVCEFDDHPDYIKVLQRPDVMNFRAVHAIQTSTGALADVLRRDNPEVRVFPNSLAVVPEILNFSNSDHFTLFYAGLNREYEWPPFIEALNRVAQQVKSRLRFLVVNDRGFFEALKSDDKAFVPRCDYRTYMSLLSQCEISFMPLLDTPFNRCKSDLKFLEASANRVLSLASHVVYSNSIIDGQTGILFHTAQELENNLLQILSDPNRAYCIADFARSHVIHHRMICKQIKMRSDWYHDLWGRRDELHRALLERVPDLG